VITPSPNALNAYQLKGLNPSKKNNECLKPEKGTCKSNKRISKGKKGVWNTHIVEERVSQATSTPSTKALMEMDGAWYLACQ
jgi:hypothetical protein